MHVSQIAGRDECDDLERVTFQRESLHIETTRNKRRYSRFETPSQKPRSCSEMLVESSCSRSETTIENRSQTASAKPCFRSVTLVGKSCSRPETASEQTPTDGTCAVKLDVVSKTQSSREALEQVADDDFRKQLELSVPLHEPGEWTCELKDVVTHHDNTDFALRRSRAKGKDSKFSDVHWTWIGRLECRCDHFQARMAFDEQDSLLEKDENSLGETHPRTCWIICDSVPVCVAIDRLRQCMSAELLVVHYTQTKSSTPLAADAQTQRGFIDERASLDVPTIADP